MAWYKRKYGTEPPKVPPKASKALKMAPEQKGELYRKLHYSGGRPARVAIKWCNGAPKTPLVSRGIARVANKQAVTRLGCR